MHNHHGVSRPQESYPQRIASDLRQWRAFFFFTLFAISDFFCVFFFFCHLRLFCFFTLYIDGIENSRLYCFSEVVAPFFLCDVPLIHHKLYKEDKMHLWHMATRFFDALYVGIELLTDGGVDMPVTSFTPDLVHRWTGVCVAVKNIVLELGEVEKSCFPVHAVLFLTTGKVVPHLLWCIAHVAVHGLRCILPPYERDGNYLKSLT